MSYDLRVTVMIGAPQGKSPPCQVWWLWHCSSRDVMVLVCHVI